MAVIASVQLAGVCHAFASLNLFRRAASRMQERWQLPVAGLLGVLACLGGLLWSLYRVWPAAPAIVCLLSLGGVVVRSGQMALRRQILALLLLYQYQLQ